VEPFAPLDTAVDEACYVEIRYWRCCDEMVSGSGAVVSSAAGSLSDSGHETMHLACHTAESLYRRMPYSEVGGHSVPTLTKPHWSRSVGFG